MESEFFAWKQAIMLGGMMMPTMQEIEKKVKDIQEAMSHRLTDNEITEVLSEKDKFRKNPHNFALKKAHLLKVLVR
jgi:RNA polymerase-associated protein RTF1